MSLNFGKKKAVCRKAKGLSQKELAKLLNHSHSVIDKYERMEMTPSIEVLIKLARVFNVSINFLIGEGQLSALDKDLLKRIEDMENLDPKTKENLFFVIVNLVQNYKTKKAFG